MMTGQQPTETLTNGRSDTFMAYPNGLTSTLPTPGSATQTERTSRLATRRIPAVETRHSTSERDIHSERGCLPPGKPKADDATPSLSWLRPSLRVAATWYECRRHQVECEKPHEFKYSENSVCIKVLRETRYIRTATAARGTAA